MGKEELVHRTIALHLTRQGDSNLSSMFLKEANLDVPEDLKNAFATLFQILADLKSHNLASAIQWTEDNREDLTQRSSNLPFQLRKLEYLRLLSGLGVFPALEYAKEKFYPFRSRHLAEIQKLMCCLVFADNLKSSPYAYYFQDPGVAFADMIHAFTREFCSILGLSSESPLHIAIMAGSLALPALLKLSTIMKKSRLEWTTEGELPVEIKLPEDYKFHSIFTCPVSKEQSTEENPPTLLPCGHCFNRDSLLRLSKGGQGRFKCPYCPLEATISQATRVWF